MSKMTKVLAGAAAVVGTALGGAAIGNAAQPQSAATTVTTPSASSAPQGVPNFPVHGSAAHEDTEKAVTGSGAAKAQAVAVKALGGGTAGEVTTNFTGSGYEVTVTKSDGSSVEVHLDSSFNVMQGHGFGQ